MVTQTNSPVTMPIETEADTTTESSGGKYYTVGAHSLHQSPT